MISSLTVKNFRGFKELQLENLRQVNVIVGTNGSGKTALLEAILLGAGAQPGVANLINLSRGLNRVLPSSLTQAQFEWVWKYLFTLDTPEAPIEISHEDSVGREALLRIFYDRNAQRSAVTETPQLKSYLSTNPPGVIAPLVFERTNYDGRTNKLYASVGDQGQLIMPFGEALGPVTTLYTGMGGFGEENMAQWFSQISLQSEGRARFLDLARRIFPSISGLEVLSPQGLPQVFASLNGSKELLPLTLISGGISKILSFVSAILASGFRVVLIDEIENGVYFGLFEKLWSLLLELVVETDTQLFVTTHSRECIDAALPVMGKQPEKFSLIRAYRKGRSNTATIAQGAKSVSVLEAGLEVRA
ncbi:MAG: AAA family ATPase [Verrucomicrobia bacterium]|nr:AAA family ATPase [Verrucomicrobiota bacterium]